MAQSHQVKVSVSECPEMFVSFTQVDPCRSQWWISHIKILLLDLIVYCMLFCATVPYLSCSSWLQTILFQLNWSSYYVLDLSFGKNWILNLMFVLVLEVMHNILKTYFKLHVQDLCHKNILFVKIMFPPKIKLATML